MELAITSSTHDNAPMSAMLDYICIISNFPSEHNCTEAKKLKSRSIQIYHTPTHFELALTNPESSEAPVSGLRLQAEEVRQVGQRVSLDAVKHHAGQPRVCQPFLRFLQEASYPDS